MSFFPLPFPDSNDDTEMIINILAVLNNARLEAIANKCEWLVENDPRPFVKEKALVILSAMKETQVPVVA